MILETDFFGQVGNTALCLKKLTSFVFGNTHPHQTFTQCVYNQNANFYILTCQIYLQVMESPLILLRFFRNFHT